MLSTPAAAKLLDLSPVQFLQLAAKSSIKPVWDGKQFAPRLMMPLSLSYDHRVVDGAMGARFTGSIGVSSRWMRGVTSS